MNRQDWLNKVKVLLPERPICIELGVYRGEFSKMILYTLTPLFLYLIDPWEEGSDKNSAPKYEGDLSGLKTAYSIVDDLRIVMGRFAEEIARGQVIIKRAYSYDAFKTITYYHSFPIFDFIYIDSCHYYNSVKADLNDYLPKLKEGGLMCLHDYGGSFEGVKRAVDEFMIEQGFSMVLLSDEGDIALKKIKR